MKTAFRYEIGLLLRSLWFWIGTAVYLAVEILYPSQKNFDGVLNFYQFSFNAQFLVVIAALATLVLSYWSAFSTADRSGYPTREEYWGRMTADALLFSGVVLVVTFSRFLIVESMYGGFDDPQLAGFTIASYFVFFLLKSVFLIVSAAIAGRSIFTLLRSNPILTLLTISFGFIVLPVAAGHYADLIHTVLQTHFSGPFAETFYYSYTSLKLNNSIILNGLISLLVILLVLLTTIWMTFRAYQKEKDFIENSQITKQ